MKKMKLMSQLATGAGKDAQKTEFDKDVVAQHKDLLAILKQTYQFQKLHKSWDFDTKALSFKWKKLGQDMSRGQALFSPQEIANMIKVWSELQSDLANCLESFVVEIEQLKNQHISSIDTKAHEIKQEHSHCEALRSSLNDAEVELNLAQKAYSKRAKPETKEALQKCEDKHAERLAQFYTNLNKFIADMDELIEEKRVGYPQYMLSFVQSSISYHQASIGILRNVEKKIQEKEFHFQPLEKSAAREAPVVDKMSEGQTVCSARKESKPKTSSFFNKLSSKAATKPSNSKSDTRPAKKGSKVAAKKTPQKAAAKKSPQKAAKKAGKPAAKKAGKKVGKKVQPVKKAVKEEEEEAAEEEEAEEEAAAAEEEAEAEEEEEEEEEGEGEGDDEEYEYEYEYEYEEDDGY